MTTDYSDSEAESGAGIRSEGTETTDGAVFFKSAIGP